MIGETEIIVAAKRQAGLTVRRDAHALRRFQHAAAAQQTLCGTLIELMLKFGEWHKYGIDWAISNNLN